MKATKKTIGLVGARGHTGAELISIINNHPVFELSFASSRDLAGRRVADHVGGFGGDLVFSESTPESIAAARADVIILALPNGASGPYVEAIDRAHPDAVVIDLSADHRFDDDWRYGLTEHFRKELRSARRIANPGCYATAIQLAVRPVLDAIDGSPTAFGVSGYSGAGTTPSDRNDPEKLRDNLMPYQLTDHIHAREAARYLGRPVRFHPHVAAFFRGITVTVSMSLADSFDHEQLDERYMEAYLSEPLVKYVTETPYVRDIARRPHCVIGGLTTSDDHAAVVATIDNLLKGAATQAIQNANVACGIDEFAGLGINGNE